MIFPIDFSLVGNGSEFRSSTFRKILTLMGSYKISYCNLRVIESLFGLVEDDTFTR